MMGCSTSVAVFLLSDREAAMAAVAHRRREITRIAAVLLEEYF